MIDIKEKMSSSTKRSLDKTYNTDKSKDAMLDTKYLFQPRGPGTAWFFRMPIPASLVGDTNPFTGKPFGKSEVRIGLGGKHSLKEARAQRDQILAVIRTMEAKALNGAVGTVSNAEEIAGQFIALPDDPDDNAREAWREALELDAERLAEKIGPEKAARWYRVAIGVEGKLVRELFEDYRAKRQPPFSVSTVNNLKTAEMEFLSFAGNDIELDMVDRKLVRQFVDDYLPQQKNAKAPKGQGPATIAKKVSMLRSVWEWAKGQDILPREVLSPWDQQGPSSAAIAAAKKSRRRFEPEEVKKLFAAQAEGTALGDIIRIALLTGVRLEEIAGLDCRSVDPKARWYTVEKGKTGNAARVIPLVDVAQRIVLRRFKAANSTGPLFPELPIRQSTGKRGGAPSQRFTKLRREVLGGETDGELAEHAFRHTWRTAAGRAGVDLRAAQTMGGWSRGKASDLDYDHGLENEQYREQQKKVAQWLRQKGYLGKLTSAT